MRDFQIIAAADEQGLIAEIIFDKQQDELANFKKSTKLDFITFAEEKILIKFPAALSYNQVDGLINKLLDEIENSKLRIVLIQNV